MKVFIRVSEWYPVYTITKIECFGSEQQEIPDDLVIRWEKLYLELIQIQKEIKKFYLPKKE